MILPLAQPKEVSSMSSSTMKIDYSIHFETVPDPNFLIELVIDKGNTITVNWQFSKSFLILPFIHSLYYV